MKAIRYYGKEDVRLDEIDEPQVRPGTVKIKPAWTGLCGSDLHLYFHGVMPPAPSHDNAHPVTGEKLPVVFGHEFSGIVEEIGEGVTGFNLGEHVVVEPSVVCNECVACRDGAYNVCEKFGFVGISGRGGGLSEYVVAEERWVHSVGNMPLDEAALIEPLAVSLHAVRMVDLNEGDVAVVGGAGPIGLLTAAVLKAHGVTTIVSEVSTARREMALEFKVADYVVDPMQQDLAEFVKAHTGGAGAAAAFDCAGVQPVFDSLLKSLKARGHLQIVAIYTNNPVIDFPAMIFKELRVSASLGYAGDHQAAIDLVHSGKVNLKPFITARINAENIAQDGYQFLVDNKETQVKVIAQLQA
ncbi:2,3-butanediol dehydrogenase [Timonella sp. A28]|uniref:2,3-butanediol dehydrogenase n=1 Tax=Timonella sp. A28 TaxID=3442640 RepID=UPI003EBAF19E